MNVTERSEEQEKIPMPLTCESAAINECRACRIYTFYEPISSYYLQRKDLSRFSIRHPGATIQ